MSLRDHIAGAAAGAALSVPGVVAGGPLCDTTARAVPIAQLAAQQGLAGDQLVTAVAVALAESSGRNDATNNNTDGSVDRCLWQINSIHATYDGAHLLADPAYCAQAMADISGRGTDWTPWVTFNRGAHLQHINEAERAAACANEPTALTGGMQDRSLGGVVERLWQRTVVRPWLRIGQHLTGQPRDAWQTADEAVFGPPMRDAHDASPPPVLPGGEEGLDPAFAQALADLISDAPGDITITSGRRTPAEQLDLWERSDKTGRWVAWSDGTSCTSNHCRGLAADLAYADPATEQWAHDNAHRYGLTYPLDWEGWHVEPTNARKATS